MTTTLSAKGQIVIPKKIREVKRLRAGDDFDVSLEEDAIVLRPLRRSKGLIEVLLACPVKGLVVPRRRKDFPRKIEL
ncbi:MAG TPA: AbrB/MazE/SpoVT family DNA-binding domain-containing protein [Verrucomicrobiae bacterium]|nr:AbrB/MazE/SpoVT family DNA-binding domain-containing protein [Verrucomicrobiae bacterium]